ERIGNPNTPALRDEVGFHTMQDDVRINAAVNVEQKVPHRLRFFLVEQFDVDVPEQHPVGNDIKAYDGMIWVNAIGALNDRSTDLKHIRNQSPRGTIRADRRVENV